MNNSMSDILNDKKGHNIVNIMGNIMNDKELCS